MTRRRLDGGSVGWAGGACKKRRCHYLLRRRSTSTWLAAKAPIARLNGSARTKLLVAPRNPRLAAAAEGRLGDLAGAGSPLML